MSETTEMYFVRIGGPTAYRILSFCFFFQAEDGIRDHCVTGVQTCALPIFRSPAADLTVYTPGTVWLKIAHGELDGERALRDGLYRAEGDFALLGKIGEWFPARR